MPPYRDHDLCVGSGDSCGGIAFHLQVKKLISRTVRREHQRAHGGYTVEGANQAAGGKKGLSYTRSKCLATPFSKCGVLMFSLRGTALSPERCAPGVQSEGIGEAIRKDVFLHSSDEEGISIEGPAGVHPCHQPAFVRPALHFLQSLLHLHQLAWIHHLDRPTMGR